MHITVNNTVTIKILTDSWLGSPGPCPNNHVRDLGQVFEDHWPNIGSLSADY